jgi:hypothetical protein
MSQPSLTHQEPNDSRVPAHPEPIGATPAVYNCAKSVKRGSQLPCARNASTIVALKGTTRRQVDGARKEKEHFHESSGFHQSK